MMECVKEERDEESYTMTDEDTEEKRDMIGVKEEGQEHTAMGDEHQYHNFTTEKSLRCSQTDKERDKAKNVFECRFCGKIYTQKRYLQYHIRTHTGERPYACSQCEKSFVRKVYFEAHIKRHSSERPYSCPRCDKTYTSKGHLKEHVW